MRAQRRAVDASVLLICLICRSRADHVGHDRAVVIASGGHDDRLAD